MFKFKVEKGAFFSGSINGVAPREVQIEDTNALSKEQIRDIIEAWLLGTISVEDKKTIVPLAKTYLASKGKTASGEILKESRGLLELITGE